MGNGSLNAAKAARNDEFYTRYADIESEIGQYYEHDHDVFRGKTVLCPCDDPGWSNFTRYFAANFHRFGLRRLICTSYSGCGLREQPTLFETTSPAYDPTKTSSHGKLYVLDVDTGKDGHADERDIRLIRHLDGDGDFRSDEVTALRDEADFVVTNPPFSRFRQMLKWVQDGGKRFILIGPMNGITRKDVFPLLKSNRMWLGVTHPKEFIVPRTHDDRRNYVTEGGRTLATFGNICWYTNVDHARRHERLRLDTMADNLKRNRRLRRKLERDYADPDHYPRYDNYDAIEVPFVQCIPSDYTAGMGVPLTFLDRWNPSQFELVGADWECAAPEPLPDGRTGTGCFYVRKPFRGDAPVFACGHTETGLRRAPHAVGVPDNAMRWRSGAMGVPITFLDRYNPDRFPVVVSRKGTDGRDPSAHGMAPYFRILIRAKQPL